MTDKIQKIYKEIEIVVNRRLNLLNGDYFDLNEETEGFTNEIMDIIDSTQEEPKTDWLQELQNKLDLLSKEDFEKVFDKYAIDFKEEPVSDGLEEAAERLSTVFAGEGSVDPKREGFAFYVGFKNGAKWQKAKDESTTEDLGEYINELSKQFVDRVIELYNPNSSLIE